MFVNLSLSSDCTRPRAGRKAVCGFSSDMAVHLLHNCLSQFLCSSRSFYSQTAKFCEGTTCIFALHTDMLKINPYDQPIPDLNV